MRPQITLKFKKPFTNTNNISSSLSILIFEKQELLEITDLKKLEKIHGFIEKETSVLSVEKKLEVELKTKWKNTKRILFKRAIESYSKRTR